ncbi:MAG: hypothetical protein QOK15_3559 [Nocardioidaceae bacterium]|nr:hypothetical protein [Nocardioidaceae bacterium]
MHSSGKAETMMSTDGLRRFVRSLAALDIAVPDAERVDQIRLLEELKSAAAAAQARVTTAFVASQEETQLEAGLSPSDVGKGIAAQVALAKRESPARGRRYIGWAGVLTGELPGTFGRLQDGEITEWRASIVARETAWLSEIHRRAIDAEVAGDLEGWGDRRVEAEVKKRAYRLDPHGYLARLAGAANDRTVTLRPAPDTMSYLTGYLPVAQGVAVLAALRRCADSVKSHGDDRSRGQIMADTLVERVTGQATAEAVPVEVNLVMTDQSVFNIGSASDEPAHLDGYGPIPAELARRLLLAAEASADAWVRRMFRSPETGELATMDSRRRLFGGSLRQLLVARDQVCRTPWCDAPIRHADHVTAVAHGGETESDNGQGLCEACNYAKQAPGWRARQTRRRAGPVTETVTPTGHRYLSRAPEPPRGREQVRLDLYFAELIERSA